jgi:hypothetical protein
MTTSWARSRARSLIMARLTWVRAVARLTTNRLGNLVVAQSLADQRQYFTLSDRSDPTSADASCGLATEMRATRSPSGSPTARAGLPRGDQPDRRNMSAGSSVLDQKPGCTCL